VKFVRFLGALVSMAVLVVAVPCGAVALARSRLGGPMPWSGLRPSSLREWEGAATDGMTDADLADVVIRLGLVVVWIAVVVVTTTVAAEVVHLVRHRGMHLPAVRGLGPAQTVARSIAAGLLALVPLVAEGARVVALDPFPAAPSPIGVVDRQDSTDAVTSIDGTMARSAPHEVPTPSVSAPVAYVVRSGDSVYAIARQIAGDAAAAAYAEAILDLNLGREMLGGSRFVNAAYIEPGWVLTLPPLDGSVTPTGQTDAAPGGHVVAPGETLWSIAEDELGDGERWPEIFDHNDGRRFADGGRLTDPDLVRPGWDLHLPGDPSSPDPVLASPVEDGPTRDEVATVDPLETPRFEAERDVDVSVDDVSVDDVVADADLADVEASVDGGGPVALGEPAPVGADAPTLPAAAMDSSVVPVNAWSTGGSGPGTDAVDESGVRLLTLRRAGMLVAGLLLVIGVRRRERLRRSTPATRALPLAAEMVSFERWLRAVDTDDRVRRLELAISAAVPVLVAAGARVVAAEVAVDGELVIHLSSPAVPEAPWSAEGATAWRLQASVCSGDLAAMAVTGVVACPALVQLGADDDGTDVFVDLEALGVLTVGGPDESSSAVVAAIAASLAGSPMAEASGLVGVGVAPESFLGQPHLIASEVAEALTLAAERLGPPPPSGRSTFDLRAGSTGDGWDPSVVVIGPGLGSVGPLEQRPGLAVVSASPIADAGWRLEPVGDVWELSPIGLRFVPGGIDERQLELVSTLVGSPSEGFVEDDDRTLPPPSDPVADHLVEIDLAASDADDAVVDPPPPLLVRLLGPVGVETADGEQVRFERSKALELVAWLALHRDRSTRGAARTAMWEMDVRDATFSNVVSDARRALARAAAPPADEEWIGRTLTDDLPLHLWVRTDADLVRAALDRAAVLGPAEAVAVLQPAVDLLVGMPFAGTTYLWPDAEGTTSALVLLATSAATQLAERYLEIGDVDGVFAATDRGLRVLPGHEGLIGLRMRAHGRCGDRAGVRHEWEQYERALHADPWADGEPAPSLVELRHQLLAG
jgi:LysM repeat protein/DNA-binding SARP family transcriptional activator